MSLLESSPALILNADFRPLSYFPLSTLSAPDAIKAVHLDRVSVLGLYEDRFANSPSTRMQLPSVIALREYIPTNRRPAFTRFNVFLRDKFCCQYCSEKFPPAELTFDHVEPRSKGGKTNWTNVVTACSDCNLDKADLRPSECGMYPRRVPVQPTSHELQQNGRGFPPSHLHESWLDYLYWDIPLETSESGKAGQKPVLIASPKSQEKLRRTVFGKTNGMVLGL